MLGRGRGPNYLLGAVITGTRTEAGVIGRSCPIPVIAQGFGTLGRRRPLQRSVAGQSGFLRHVRSDQGLEHVGEASGGAVGTEALNAEAGALAQQEQFVGKQLRITQSRLAAEFNNPLAAAVLECLDHSPGR